jgi:hypothetical protein
MLGTLLDRCLLAPSHRLKHLLWAIFLENQGA